MTLAWFYLSRKFRTLKLPYYHRTMSEKNFDYKEKQNSFLHCYKILDTHVAEYRKHKQLNPNDYVQAPDVKTKK